MFPFCCYFSVEIFVYGGSMDGLFMSSSIFPYVLPHVRALDAYTPGMQPKESGWVKLNTNENPYPPSPEVISAIQAVLKDHATGLRLYPNPESISLRAGIAKQLGFDTENILIGNGSDDILNLLIRTFCDKAYPAGWCVPSYSLYPVLVAMNNGRMIDVRFDEKMELDVDGVVNCGANLFFLTNPNAPTGVAFSQKTIRAIAERFKGILVVDEAYIAFAGEDSLGLVREFPNVCVTRTFSKSHGLAGLRLGYLIGSTELIGYLDRVRDSYNVDRIAQVAGLAAIQDTVYYRDVTAKVNATRDWTLAQLETLGFFTYPSSTNFVFTQPKNGKGKVSAEVARSLFDYLTAKKILVRYFSKDKLTEAFLRVSIGTQQEMEIFIQTLKSWIKDA